MTKRIILIRHGKNQGDKLTPEGMAEIIENFGQEAVAAPFYKVSDVFYSPLYRSLQTALVIMATIGIRARVHLPIPQLGNGPWMAEIFPKEFEDLLDTGLPMIPAMKQFHGEAKVKQWFDEVMEGIGYAFATMRGDLALVVGHGPMIPMAIMVLRGGDYQSIENLESVVIEQRDDGTLRIVA
jgi:broad specificity phosphatase PhoE